ncbi:AbgT family transporter [Cerasibacillus terrae]|uniref:AbgT family transporter n=1 Tax=Cerasibacillus terrae TaxID=2498845 RepID=A0A5C8NEC6_9BACI|nr:AbgT family transporter [Cerasibacillus terrae]TXL57812.1 AbgT family transporter [Cerasibacillus terrae]
MATEENGSPSRISRILNGIERIGNRLPDPFMLFVYLALIVIVLSSIIALFNISFYQPGVEEKVFIQSLLSKDGIQFMITSMIDNFVGFKPLGIVLTMMLGVGLADKVGLLETAIKCTIVKAPPSLITYAVVLTGILGNLASDAAFVIIPPLSAMVFYNIGRHPLAGLAAGFAGVGSGYTANFMVSGADALLSGISTEVVQTIDENVVVTPVDNWYFMIASVVVLSVIGALVTEKIVEPRLGKYTGDVKKEFTKVQPREWKGFINAVIAGLIYIAFLISIIFLPNSPLTNEDGGMVPSPFLTGIVPILFFLFIIVGVTYGITVKKITDTRSIGKYMGEAMRDMAGFIVLIFSASQFISYFEWSNIGSWIAVSGANFLQSVGLTGITVIIGFVLLTAILNLFIFSGSAQWALEAPIFIKMFYFLDYHPAFVQVAYRIADSSTNVITPMNPYIIIILSFMKDYDKKAGIGTLIALMLPYSIFFLGSWIILLLLFIFLEIPFGPGIGVYL